MSTINQLIADVEAERSAARQRIEVIVDAASAEGRSSLTLEEDKRCEREFAKVESADKNLLRLREIQAEEQALESRFSSVRKTNSGFGNRALPKYDEVARVGRERRQYDPESDPRGRNFLTDVCRYSLHGDVLAGDRLLRHMKEETVERPQYMNRAAQGYEQRATGDSTTSNWFGLVVPQYLVDMVAPAVANMRPFADAATTKHVLPPDGMTVNISQVTTPAAAGLQSTQLTALSTATIDDTLLTINVLTAGGFNNVSRQAIDRGTGIDDTILNDLFARYATDLDNQLINQASTGAIAVAQNVDLNVALTGPVVYSKIIGAASLVHTALLNMGHPTHVTMHSRRWDYLTSQSTTSWPFISNQPANGPGSTFGQLTDPAYGRGVVGTLPNGLRVIVDNNVPTNITADTVNNTDAILVTPQSECHLWEDPNQPTFIRAEQPNAASLGVLLVVYGYYAYTHSRYSNALAKVTGGTLVAPTF